MKNRFLYIALLAPLFVFGQKLQVKDILKKELVYQFEGGAIMMIISTDSTLYWKNGSKGTSAHEKSKTIHVNEHAVMTAWYESDKTFVSLLSDFETLKVSGMVCRADGKFYPVKGTIVVK